MSEQQPTSPFDAIRRTDEDGGEYWSARDLSKILGYTEYGKFRNTIKKAEQAAEGSSLSTADHFAHVSDMIEVGKGAKRKAQDVHLTRYGAYLVVMNADPNKEIVAQAQTYFAEQTRRQELADAEAFASLPADRQRLLLRGELRSQDTRLTQAATEAGVITPADHDQFQDAGYKGLYGGLDRQAIKEKKTIEPAAELLDHVGYAELAANLFRATQTADKLRRDQIQGTEAASEAHHEVGQIVRRAIAEVGNQLPEDLPAAAPPIAALEAQERQKLNPGPKKPGIG